jgi:hypothetical protein
VYALDGATGTRKWACQLGDYVYSSPALDLSGSVYVGCFDGKLYALNDATGVKRWQFLTQASYRVRSSPAIGKDGTVYVGSDNRELYAVNGATGARKWVFWTLGQIAASPTVAEDGTVYIGSADGNLYALDGDSGSKKWSFAPGSEIRSSAAVADDGVVYVASWDGKLWAVRGTSGLADSPWPKFRRDARNTGRSSSPPGFEKQPRLAVMEEGREGRLTAQVSGAPVPQVQWFCNATAVVGATNATLLFPTVTRAQEGLYWLVASNLQGQATSAPIVAVVSNVDPERLVALKWPANPAAEVTVMYTDQLGPGAVWRALTNYPPSTIEPRFVELEAAPMRFYRLSASGPGPVLPPVFTGAGLVNGWWYTDTVGTKHLVEYVAAATGWTNWGVLTNLVLPASPYLFLDAENVRPAARVYRTTPVP